MLVLLAFYAPRFGAFLSIVASLFATIGWYLAGNPCGVDNAYVALATPLLIMTLSHLLRRLNPQPLERSLASS